MQTGSGKTFTMQPLPPRAAEDIFKVISIPDYSGLQLHVRCVGGACGVVSMACWACCMWMGRRGLTASCMLSLEEYPVRQTAVCSGHKIRGGLEEVRAWCLRKSREVCGASFTR